MSVSRLPAAAAAAKGERVSNRHYVARFKCPLCPKIYAKPTAYVRHLKAHRRS